ncbi:hypothetical protein EW093_16205 [Thiospirochaeta perfilievii]|uniref:Uncharacterized protein n=1 Tax=Thiospirochaeta perfilievii TaxID=252967 RepID=A0A5C1QHZ7_9SPIO|nr:hypothetical protein [Thiospirochaeta perfilievii]QEN06164.1 hypothetical protein EW093_16205 [Thiospirochaeta perfilievii]
MNLIKKMVVGYSSLLEKGSKSILTGFKVILFILFVFGVSVLVVYPLWFLADKSPASYSQFVKITIIVVVISYILFKIVSVIKSGGFIYFLTTYLIPFFTKIFKIALLISTILLTIYLYSSSLLLGVLSTTFLLFIYGIIKFGFKK